MGLQSPLDPITVSLSLVSLIGDIIVNITSIGEINHESFVKITYFSNIMKKHLSIPI